MNKYEEKALSEMTTRNALVTGAAGAIGKAVATRLVQSGCKVIMVDLDDKKLTEITDELGGNAIPIACDLSEQSEISLLTDRVIDTVGNIDILINNVGILSNNKIATTSLGEWQKVFAINLESAFLLSQAFLAGMRKNKWGRIINISSYAAKCGGLTAGTAYSVSKSGMIGLTFSTARETVADGITVNAIAPAYVMSPMISEQLTAVQRAEQLKQIPVGRFCEPSEVAHTVQFLASAHAGFITGEVIDMNGGLQFD